MKYRLACASTLVVSSLLAVSTAGAGPLDGAIFTTTVNGNVVNGNVIYEQKEDVYLDGGPGPNAPAKAAGLPEGDYYYQVTDPSGKELLSTDHISCRMVHVNVSGVIDTVYGGFDLAKVQGTWAATPCLHLSGTDIDHSELGAVTVQLYPYDDTPNPGGVYKVWMTPVAAYAGILPDCEGMKGGCNVSGAGWEPGNVHGFIPSWSKTDNYKVDKKGKPFVSPVLNVFKFHDKNFNGVQDTGEDNVTGWAINIAEPSATSIDLFTPVVGYLTAEAGTYLVTEATPAGTLQTAATLDGLSVTPANPVQVAVAGESGETHTVVFGNVGRGSVTACKVFDRNGNGVGDADEPGIAGWKIQLDGVDLAGSVVGPTIQETGGDGCTTFADLMPGSYTVTELMPPGDTWIATGTLTASADIEPSLDGADISGTVLSHAFTNVCTATADFGTKGFWHNKNGLSEITAADIAYINTLAPYASPSTYFGAGDEPFDGYFTDGTPVEAAFNNTDLALAAAEGTPLAEISHFLTDANAGGDPREQLAQQLLAFIFNTLHRLDDQGAAIQLPDGSFVAADSLITQAIALWVSGEDAARNAMQQLLDGFNNNDAVAYVPLTPCAVTY